MFFRRIVPHSLNRKHVLVSPSIFTGQWKDKLARVRKLPANQLRTVFPCLHSRLQLILTSNSVKLLDSGVYFPTHPPHLPYISIVATLRQSIVLYCIHLGCYIHTFIFEESGFCDIALVAVFLINGFGDKCCWDNPSVPH